MVLELVQYLLAGMAWQCEQTAERRRYVGRKPVSMIHTKLHVVHYFINWMAMVLSAICECF